jgi:ribonucleoside-diphosphate reductase alpha chain
MSLTTETASSQRHSIVLPAAEPARPQAEPGYQIIRRNGSVTPFDPSKISVALTKAFLAIEGITAASSTRVHDVVGELTQQIVASLTRRADGRTFHIEDVQDQVELALMRSEHHKVARAYVIYREERTKERAKAAATAGTAAPAASELRMKSHRRHQGSLLRISGRVGGDDPRRDAA